MREEDEKGKGREGRDIAKEMEGREARGRKYKERERNDGKKRERERKPSNEPPDDWSGEP